jgi:hypothetical protein
MGDDKKPDRVKHSRESALPGGLGPKYSKTTIEKGDDKYTGYGKTEKDANRDAGEKYSRGDKD